MCNSPFAVTNYGTKNLLGGLFAFLTARFEMLPVLLLVADAQDYAPDVQGKQGIEQDCQCGERDLLREKGCLVGRVGVIERVLHGHLSAFDGNFKGFQVQVAHRLLSDS
mgnify:CR=1 FL=1